MPFIVLINQQQTVTVLMVKMSSSHHHTTAIRIIFALFSLFDASSQVRV